VLTTQNYAIREGETVDTPDISLSFANHVNGVTWDQPEPGYLTVVTRCYKRKEKLGINQQSLFNQSDGDWDQVCIHGEVDVGLHKANGLLHKHRHLVKGKYVLLLDDDDKLTDNDFVKKLKDRDEDIIWFGGSCLVVKNQVFQDHIGGHAFLKEISDLFLADQLDKKHKYTKYHIGDSSVDGQG